MTIVVCPLDAVGAACATHAPPHTIGLLGPDAPLPAISSGARLDLRFNDIVAETEGLVAPSDRHVAQFIAFLADWDRASPLLIYCWAGVSRSTAGALIAAAVRDGPGVEAQAAQRLRQVAPFATPNRRLITLADAQLRRGGAMTAATEAIGRGAETSMGALFRL